MLKNKNYGNVLLLCLNPHICGGIFFLQGPLIIEIDGGNCFPLSDFLHFPPTFVALGWAALGRCELLNFSLIIIENFLV
jgi:hypothetical protein